MTKPALFDFPLSKLQLIEASAGTGKTWTISGLFVRLILEANLSVEQILVVTYTKAATAELRDRLRKRLAEVRLWLETGKFDEQDHYAKAVVSAYQTIDEKTDALKKITNAIRGFDQAAIYTIHGFCQRVLTDAALEAGVPFEQELITDDSDIVRELIEDEWRVWAYQGHSSVLSWVASKKITPSDVFDDLRKWVGKNYLQYADIPDVDLAGTWKNFAEQFVTTQSEWLRSHEDISKRLLCGGLNARSYSPAKIEGWLKELATVFATDNVNLANVPDWLDKLGSQKLIAATKKNCEAPTHPFFDKVEKLVEYYAKVNESISLAYLHWQVDLLKKCNQLLPEKKTRLGVLSFDDLLNRLAEALQTNSATTLIQKVNQQFKAALIDEFQDTDPVQYQIFHTLFHESDSPVFLVGDPKQAIYSFRGADIFTYLSARSDTANQFSLDVNQRSAEPLVKAVNQLFLAAKRPFAVPGITYEDVGAKQIVNALKSADGLSPLCLSYFDVEEEDDELKKESANHLAAEGCATEIVRLLNQTTETLGIEDAKASQSNLRRIHGGDIAVLVNTHKQGALMMEALSKRKVPAVQQATISVFETREAEELLRVLQAIQAPQNHKLIKAALITDYFGYSGEQLEALANESEGWDIRLEQFTRYLDIWKSRGFMPMARTWLEDERLASKLLDFQDGERRLTNLLHLFELIQTESVASHGLESLIDWFIDQCNQSSSSQDEVQTRLESDAKRVKIVTIHASKGLEYPIVFCPFTWSGSKFKQNGMLVGRNENNEPVLHFLPDEQVAEQVQLEEYAEKLRLLYVALTRAKYRCYVAWHKVSECAYAPLSWLLHPLSEESENPRLDLQNHFAAVLTLTSSELIANMQTLANENPTYYSLVKWTNKDDLYIKPASETLALKPGVFSRLLKSSWQMSSFTSLTRQVSAQVTEMPDYDGAPILLEEPANDENTELTMFDFPRGARAGTFLHTLFESIDFTKMDDPTEEEIIQNLLLDHGYEPHWLDILTGMVRSTLRQPMNESGHSLSMVSNGRRFVEMEFTFKLPSIPMLKLSELLSNPSWNVPSAFQVAAKSLDFSTLNGYLKGFIDLICEIDGRFYLIDYKSNWLGNRPEDYSVSNLTHAIAVEHYYLQFLIYTVALHRYLAKRMPDQYHYETHFGGVRYLFLRGTATDIPHCGVFSYTPHPQLVVALDALFAESLSNQFFAEVE